MFGAFPFGNFGVVNAEGVLYIKVARVCFERTLLRWRVKRLAAANRSCSSSHCVTFTTVLVGLVLASVKVAIYLASKGQYPTCLNSHEPLRWLDWVNVAYVYIYMFSIASPTKLNMYTLS